MTDEAKTIAEIAARHRQPADVLDSGLYYPNVARIHADRAALLAIVKRQQSEIDALTDDISRALETIAAENEARVAAEKREAALLVEIQEAQTLLTNVRGWLSRGASEHSMENIDAYWQRWRAIGHKALAGGPT